MNETPRPTASAEKPQPAAEETPLPSEQPFPLQSRFRRRILPGLVVFVVAMVAATGWAARHVIETIYLDQAQRRAETIARAVESNAPIAWRALVSGTLAKDPGAERYYATLRDEFAREVEELKLIRLNVYDLTGRTIFATIEKNIGKIETGAALRDAIRDREPGLVAKVYDEVGDVYELYVPLLDEQGRAQVIFELYEPVQFLNAVLIRGTLPAVAVPWFFLCVLVWALSRLVGRAQADITHRTDALNALRRRLESFVSASAVTAARDADDGGEIPSRRIRCTLFYSDVRDYTGFAESHTPEEVVAMINALFGVQVTTIREHGGDVDKMIGDAVLARFDGPTAELDAIAAAKEILDAIAAGDHPRGVGIGVFTGDVLSGAIGPADRRDFTVMGDAVNISARLCAKAEAGALVADEATVAAAGDDAGFGRAESVSVKGRRQALSVRTWRADAP